MGDSPIERFRGGASNLPEATGAGVGRVTVHASRWYTPVGIGIAGAWGADGLIHAVPNLVHHLPVVGGMASTVIGGAEHLPFLTAGLAVAGGIVVGKKVGGAVQRHAKAAVERNGL